MGNSLFKYISVCLFFFFKGISNLIYQDQPSMSVISNGAECIMISKKFFMEKKTDATMRSIYQSVCLTSNLNLSRITFTDHD